MCTIAIRESAGVWAVWHNQIDVVIDWHSATTRYYLTNTYKLVTELYLGVNL